MTASNVEAEVARSADKHILTELGKQHELYDGKVGGTDIPAERKCGIYASGSISYLTGLEPHDMHLCPCWHGSPGINQASFTGTASHTEMAKHPSFVRSSMALRRCKQTTPHQPPGEVLEVEPQLAMVSGIYAAASARSLTATPFPRTPSTRRPTPAPTIRQRSQPATPRLPGCARLPQQQQQQGKLPPPPGKREASREAQLREMGQRRSLAPGSRSAAGREGFQGPVLPTYRPTRAHTAHEGMPAPQRVARRPCALPTPPWHQPPAGEEASANRQTGATSVKPGITPMGQGTPQRCRRHTFDLKRDTVAPGARQSDAGRFRKSLSWGASSGGPAMRQGGAAVGAGGRCSWGSGAGDPSAPSLPGRAEPQPGSAVTAARSAGAEGGTSVEVGGMPRIVTASSAGSSSGRDMARQGKQSPGSSAR